MGSKWIALAGMALLIGLAVLLSTNRRAIRLRVVIPAFLLQAGIAILVLYVPAGKAVILWMSTGVGNLLGYAQAGTNTLFGPLADPKIGGHSFAIAALPVIIFFAALVSILYHLGIMQLIVRWVGGAIEKVTGISRVESLCAAANIFIGQSESPLVIRPYLAGLAPSQLFTVMVTGMAGVAGTILAAYAAMGIRIDYLLTASFMAAPGAILMAKLMMPDDPETIARADALIDVRPGEEERAANLIQAAANGAQTGVRLAVAVGAMVLAFVALVALANGVLAGLGNWFGFPGLSFQSLLGLVFAPIVQILGVAPADAAAGGGLLGTKLVLNEFVAFIDLGKMQADMMPRSVAILTFALCGFANFSSIAIQMAVTGGLAPNQRPVIARLGIRALIAGSLANLMSAAFAGLLIG